MALLTVTATSVLPSVVGFNQAKIAAGVTVTQGTVGYINSSGEIALAQSNGGSAGDNIRNAPILITSAGSPGQYALYIAFDAALAITTSAALVSGDRIFLANTAGRMTVTIGDLAAGSTVVVLGVVNTDLTVRWNPTYGGVTS